VKTRGDEAIRRYQDSKRLAYQSEVPVNWCPALGTVLAGMDVADKLVQGDMIRGIRVWDGVTAMSTPTIIKQ